MANTPTQKESMLLTDLIAAEKLCIDKYTRYAGEACDGQLKNLFSQIRQSEQTHHDTLVQISSGTVPNMSGGSAQPAAVTAKYTAETNDACKQTDEFLCADALAGEKHVSSEYDTSIFEFVSPQTRAALNHIQKEEQQHGEMLWNYMSQNGMQC